MIWSYRRASGASYWLVKSTTDERGYSQSKTIGEIGFATLKEIEEIVEVLNDGEQARKAASQPQGQKAKGKQTRTGSGQDGTRQTTRRKKVVG